MKRRYSSKKYRAREFKRGLPKHCLTQQKSHFMVTVFSVNDLFQKIIGYNFDVRDLIHLLSTSKQLTLFFNLHDLPIWLLGSFNRCEDDIDYYKKQRYPLSKCIESKYNMVYNLIDTKEKRALLTSFKKLQIISYTNVMKTKRTYRVIPLLEYVYPNSPSLTLCELESLINEDLSKCKQIKEKRVPVSSVFIVDTKNERITPLYYAENAVFSFLPGTIEKDLECVKRSNANYTYFDTCNFRSENRKKHLYQYLIHKILSAYVVLTPNDKEPTFVDTLKLSRNELYSIHLSAIHLGAVKEQKSYFMDTIFPVNDVFQYIIQFVHDVRDLLHFLSTSKQLILFFNLHDIPRWFHGKFYSCEKYIRPYKTPLGLYPDPTSFSSIAQKHIMIYDLIGTKHKRSLLTSFKKLQIIAYVDVLKTRKQLSDIESARKQEIARYRAIPLLEYVYPNSQSLTKSELVSLINEDILKDKQVKEKRVPVSSVFIVDIKKDLIEPLYSADNAVFTFLRVGQFAEDLEYAKRSNANYTYFDNGDRRSKNRTTHLFQYLVNKILLAYVVLTPNDKEPTFVDTTKLSRNELNTIHLNAIHLREVNEELLKKKIY